MIGTITYILARAGWRAMNGTITDERRRLAGAEIPATYVSYDPRLLAGVGWYGYRIAFKGGDRQMIERARYMLSERYTIRDSYEYYADGVYVIGVLLRQRVPHYGIGGAQPTPEPDTLNFYMPNGGTVSLNKTGSPTVVELEYSLDGGQTWTVWQPDNNGNRSLVLSAGQRMYIRNTSETSTAFSTYGNRYKFAFTDIVEADGNVNSLICKNTENAVICNAIFNNLFSNCTTLVTAPQFPSTVINVDCYNSAFSNCINLIKAPELPATTIYQSAYSGMFEYCKSLVNAPKLFATVVGEYGYSNLFNGCSSIAKVETNITTMTNTSLFNWLYGVSPTGDFYCPAELTIPTGVSGIPSGWTRHDI